MDMGALGDVYVNRILLRQNISALFAGCRMQYIANPSTVREYLARGMYRFLSFSPLFKKKYTEEVL